MVNVEGLVRESPAGDLRFKPEQLDLPLGAVAMMGVDRASSFDTSSSDAVLSDYLDVVGVSQPELAAQLLIAEFGSVAAVISASWWRLRSVIGARLACTILASRNLIHAAMLESVKEGPVVPRSEALLAFLQARVGLLKHECVLALYVDDRLHLLRLEHLADGGVNEANINIRGVIRCGLEVAASGLIMVHNHPAGDPTPSKSDLSFTQRLRSIAAEVEIHLLDHLIVARGRVGSILEYWHGARWAGGEE